MKIRIIHIINRLINKGLKSNAMHAFTNIEQLKEIMPDLLCGCLSEDEMPNSLVLLSPPPELNSEAFILDLEHAKKAVESKVTIRFIQAANDANLSFPAAVKSFESTLDIKISEEKHPSFIYAQSNDRRRFVYICS